MPNQVHPADLRERPKLRQLLLREHIPRTHEPTTQPSTVTKRTGGYGSVRPRSMPQFLALFWSGNYGRALSTSYVFGSCSYQVSQRVARSGTQVRSCRGHTAGRKTSMGASGANCRAGGDVDHAAGNAFPNGASIAAWR